MKKEIKFEYFVDPLGSNLSEVGDRNAEEIIEDIRDDEDIDADIKEMLPRSKDNIKVLSTPFGLVSITESNQPAKYFELWLGYTNFDLTEEVIQKIEDVPGVESIEVFSRYRFRIMIGKLFKSSDVMTEITKVALEELPVGICVHELTEEDKGIVHGIVQKINVHKHWLIYLLPNGQTHSYFTDDNEPVFTTTRSLMEETQSKIGGFLFTS